MKKHLPEKWDKMTLPAQQIWLGQNYGIFIKGKFGVQGYSEDAHDDVKAAIAEIRKEFAEAAKRGEKIN